LLNIHIKKIFCNKLGRLPSGQIQENVLQQASKTTKYSN
jgi:hypothetical protein